MRRRSEESILLIFLEGAIYPVVEQPFPTPTRMDEIRGITFTAHIII